MILKLDMQHWRLKLHKVYITVNDDPGLTLTYFTARSNLVMSIRSDGEDCYKFFY